MIVVAAAQPTGTPRLSGYKCQVADADFIPRQPLLSSSFTISSPPNSTIRDLRPKESSPEKTSTMADVDAVIKTTQGTIIRRLPEHLVLSNVDGKSESRRNTSTTTPKPRADSSSSTMSNVTNVTINGSQQDCTCLDRPSSDFGISCRKPDCPSSAKAPAAEGPRRNSFLQLL